MDEQGKVVYAKTKLPKARGKKISAEERANLKSIGIRLDREIVEKIETIAAGTPEEVEQGHTPISRAAQTELLIQDGLEVHALIKAISRHITEKRIYDHNRIPGNEKIDIDDIEAAKEYKPSERECMLYLQISALDRMEAEREEMRKGTS